LNQVLTLQVSEGTADAEDSIDRPSRGSAITMPCPQQGQPGGVRAGDPREQPPLRFCVALGPQLIPVALLLPLPSAFDPIAHDRARLTSRGPVEWHGRGRPHLDTDVDAIDQRTRDTRPIAIQYAIITPAAIRSITAVPARARIHRSYKHDTSRQVHATGCS
jgi:hypothetical protein